MRRGESTLISFWQRFSDNPREALHLKNAIRAEEFGLEDVRGVLKALCGNPAQASTSLRAFDEGSQNYRLMDTVVHSPPAEGECLESWMYRISGRRRFGLVVNYAERWNDELTRKVARFLRPFLGKARPASYLIELNLFLGNYGYTPFGAHYDDDATSVVHLHLGPAPKIMTLWSPSVYTGLTGSQRAHFEPEKIVDKGQNFYIEAGDVFMLPADCFHVGFTDKFSGAIALAVSPLSRSSALQRALGSACGDLRRESAQGSLKGWISRSMRRYVAQHASLLGFHSPPLERDLVDLTGKTIQLSAPFRIGILRSGSRINLYVRGAEISMRANSLVQKAICNLNRGDSIRTNAWVAKLKSAITEEAALEILGALYRYRGIEVTS